LGRSSIEVVESGYAMNPQEFIRCFDLTPSLFRRQLFELIEKSIEI